ncbi:MAG: hypothetical protein PCFJNLEI_00088 [Verrucomicrobiae bacterium]|nr:hypothetical protein [Verrucomicrobiae bacterium]
MPEYLLTKDAVTPFEDLTAGADPEKVVAWKRSSKLDAARCGYDWIVVRSESTNDARRKVELPLEAARLELSRVFTIPAFAAWVRAAAIV